jgi:hypothetical protein
MAKAKRANLNQHSGADPKHKKGCFQGGSDNGRGDMGGGVGKGDKENRGSGGKGMVCSLKKYGKNFA